MMLPIANSSLIRTQCSHTVTTNRATSSDAYEHIELGAVTSYISVRVTKQPFRANNSRALPTNPVKVKINSPLVEPTEFLIQSRLML